jgi:hypothetical protein
MLRPHASAQRRFARRASTVVVTGLALLLGASGLAHADNIQDTIADTGAGLTLEAGSPDGQVAQVKVIGNSSAGDDDPGCNIDANEAPLVLDIVTPAGVTASPDPLAITACGTDFPVTFTAGPSAVGGTATVTIVSTPAGGGGYLNQVSIPITITRTNTPPAVAVAGVADGATYRMSATPQPGCSVVDAEDTGEAATPTVTGGAYDDLGSHTVTCSYTDRGNLTRTASATYTVIRDLDDTPPTVTPVLAPATPDGSNGWYTQDVSLSWTVTEPQSPETLTTTGCGSTSVDEDQDATTYTCSATSEGGSDEESVSIKRDSQAPDAPLASLSPIPNNDGWNNGDVLVHFEPAGDNGPSGIASCTADTSVTDEGEDQVVTGTCTDRAGNTSAATQVTIDLDRTAPVVSETVTIDGDEGADGWYTSDVTVTFTATDNLSGFGAGGDSKSVTSSGEGEAVEVSSPAFTDRADNTTTPAGAVVKTFKIDKHAPEPPEYTLTPAPNGEGWNNTDVVVSFQDQGDNGPSGIDECSADVTVDTDTGGQVVTGTCTDKAGNTSEPTTVTVKRDTQAPNAPVATLDPPANTLGWHQAAVTVGFSTGGDNGPSGVVGCTPDVTVSDEGADQPVTGTCTDAAGNVGAARTVSVSIDRTAPTIGLDGGPQEGASYYFGSVPATPSCVAVDSLSGVNGGCPVSGHGTSVGTHTIRATATDKAGNTTTVSRTYTVLAWDAKGFYAPVDMGGVLNTVKGGSTVPLKFELFAGTSELTDVAAVKSFTTQKVNCDGSAPADAIEITSTGGTSLRYDSTGGQFIQNWKTPTGAGTCYRAIMEAQDGTRISALFKLK